MAEQLELNAEPPAATQEPQGIPTFGDMPESAPFAPRITFAEDETADEPATTPEPETPTSPPAAEFSPPTAVAPSGGVGSAQELFQAMAALDDYKEQKRYAQERQTASREWQPPTISDEQAEEILSDPKKFAAFQAAKDKWHREAAINTIQPVLQTAQSLQAELNGIRYRQHQEAWQTVRDEMQANGVDADSYYGQIEMSLRSNPQTYWSLATNPQALKTAVEVLHRSAGNSHFTATPQTPKAPPTVGTTTTAPRQADRTPTFQHEAITKAEKVFGKKWTKEMRESFRKTIQAGRG